MLSVPSRGALRAAKAAGVFAGALAIVAAAGVPPIGAKHDERRASSRHAISSAYTIQVNHQEANGKVEGASSGDVTYPHLAVKNRRAVWFEVANTGNSGGLSAEPDADLLAQGGILPPNGSIGYTVGPFSGPDQWSRFMVDPGTLRAIVLNLGDVVLKLVGLTSAIARPTPSAGCIAAVVNASTLPSIQKLTTKLREGRYRKAAKSVLGIVKMRSQRRILSSVFHECWETGIKLGALRNRLLRVATKLLLKVKDLRDLLVQVFDTIVGSLHPTGTLYLVSCGSESEIGLCQGVGQSLAQEVWKPVGNTSIGPASNDGVFTASFDGTFWGGIRTDPPDLGCDYRFSGEARIVEGDGYGFVVRTVFDGTRPNGHGIQYDPGIGGYRDTEYPEGTETGPVEPAALDNEWHTVAVEIENNRYREFIDGELVFSDVTDSVCGGLYIRLWRTEASFRNLTVSQLPQE